MDVPPVGTVSYPEMADDAVRIGQTRLLLGCFVARFRVERGAFQVAGLDVYLALDPNLSRSHENPSSNQLACIAKSSRCNVPSTHDPKANHLLSVLSEAEWSRIAPHMTQVDLPLGHVLYESGDKLDHVYFPTTAIVSLLYVMEDGASAEIAIVGNEGIVGIAIFMGGETTPSRAIVQSAGVGYRLSARVLKQEFTRGGPIQRLLLRYTQALITQMAQTAVCNRHHSIVQQFCRWLLLSIDRLPSNELRMTQELIANMLGVRRSGVTEAALKLQSAGVIRYSHGNIEVLDRPALERNVCECYAVVKREFDRLLPDEPAL